MKAKRIAEIAHEMAQLSKEMNRLTERNDAILSTLRGRGFEPVRVSDKPLTRQQIHSRNWFCKDSGPVCKLVLLRDYGYTARDILITEGDEAQLNKREIIRNGNEFYYV